MPRMEIPVIGIGAGGGHRRPGARLPRPARHLRRPRGALREALRERPRRDDQGRERRSPTRCARGATPSRSTATRWRRTRSRGSTSCSASRPASRSRAGSRSDASTAGELRFSTEGNGDTIDITAGVQSVDRPVRRGERPRVRVRARLDGRNHDDGARAGRRARPARGARPPDSARGRLRTQPAELRHELARPHPGGDRRAVGDVSGAQRPASRSAPGSRSCSWTSTIAPRQRTVVVQVVA